MQYPCRFRRAMNYPPAGPYRTFGLSFGPWGPTHSPAGGTPLTSRPIADALPIPPLLEPSEGARGRFRFGSSLGGLRALVAAVLTACFCGLLPSAGARADSALLTTLHAFTGAEGANPFAGLVQGTDGDFYGTAYQGGANNSGTIFKITPSGALRVLYTFSAANWDPYAQASINADGSGPLALVRGADGGFYGVTPYGGAGGAGTVFKITPRGELTTLHTFSVLDPYSQTNPDGAHPYAGLTEGADGNFYGTTHDGGANGYGTVFRITPQGSFVRLHTFMPLNYYGINRDGANPAASLAAGADGALYGTTFWGGANGNGTVFKITPKGTFTLLHAFSAFTSTNYSGYGINAEGANPSVGLVSGDDGSFYGAASYGGGHGLGAIFHVTPDGAVTTLYSFSRLDGASPNSLLHGADGNLYGTASQGGNRGDGAVFSLSPEGAITLLHAFSSDQAQAEEPAGNRDGSFPSGLTQGVDGSLYGTAYSGGKDGGGTVFRLMPALKLRAASVSRDSATGGYTAVVTLQNTGYTTAPALTLLHAALNSVGTTSALPILVGDLAPGASTTLTLAFPASAGASGSDVHLRVAVTLPEGRFYGASKVTLP